MTSLRIGWSGGCGKIGGADLPSPNLLSERTRRAGATSASSGITRCASSQCPPHCLPGEHSQQFHCRGIQSPLLPSCNFKTLSSLCSGLILITLQCVNPQMKDPEMETEDVRRTIFSVAAQYGLVQG